MATKGRKTAYAKADEQIGGFNVYHDDKGRPIYYNRMNHVGYVLTDQAKQFRTYSSRFFLGISAAIIAYMFDIPVIYSILLGVVAYVVLEVKFRRFLKQLPQIPNYKPVKSQGKIEAEAHIDIRKIITKIVLFLALSILLIINANMQGYKDIMLYLNWALSVFALVMAGIEVRALMIKRSR